MCLSLEASLSFHFSDKYFNYNPFLVYRRELAPGTVSLTGDRAQGDDSKYDSHYSYRDDKSSLKVKPMLPQHFRICFHINLFAQSDHGQLSYTQ